MFLLNYRFVVREINENLWVEFAYRNVKRPIVRFYSCYST